MSPKPAPGAIRSMTGFARARRTICGYDVTVSLKSVNHRGLDLHFHTSADLDPYENAMRSAIKQKTSRGHIDIRVNIVRAGEDAAPEFDASRLDQYVKAFRHAAKVYGLSGEPDLNSALRIPGMFSEAAATEYPPEFEAGLIALLHEALDTLNAFRTREGSELAAVILERNRDITAAAARIEQIRERALPYFQNRLKDRLAELLDTSTLDPQRVAQEAAMIADRGDIGEETARLKIHARQLEEIVRGECEIGKKLDFLLQEMNRETNTVLSKTAGIGEPGLEITDLALRAKSDIEKIREQSLNIE
jgi:uncharacterized protein (TIGR00255 family)